MSKPPKPGDLNTYTMENMSFDVEKAAWRITLVDDQGFSSSGSTTERIIERIVPVEKEVVRVERVEVPVIVKETQILEVPTIVNTQTVEVKYVDQVRVVTETVYKEIEKPVLVEKLIYVDKPVLVEKLTEKVPGWIFGLLMAQTIVTLGSLILFAIRSK